MYSFNVGDITEIQISNETRGYGNYPPDGTKALIMGFTHIAYGRVNNCCKEPGWYENTCYPIIQLESGEVQVYGTHMLKRLPNMHWRESRRIKDLPETPFYEDDVVLFTRREDTIQVRVDLIHYNVFGGATYDVKLPTGGNYCFVEEKDLELVERGRVWKIYHGEAVQFSSLKEEFEFAIWLGRYDEVMNSARAIYSWTKDEVLFAIRNESVPVDALHHYSSAVLMRDRELGGRVRAKFLKDGNLD